MSTNPTNSGWILYHYSPSKGGAIAVTVLFTVLSILYTVQSVWDAMQSLKEVCGVPFNVRKKTVNMSLFKRGLKLLKIFSTTSVLIPFLVG